MPSVILLKSIRSSKDTLSRQIVSISALVLSHSLRMAAALRVNLHSSNLKFIMPGLTFIIDSAELLYEACDGANGLIPAFFSSSAFYLPDLVDLGEARSFLFFPVAPAAASLASFYSCFWRATSPESRSIAYSKFSMAAGEISLTRSAMPV